MSTPNMQETRRCVVAVDDAGEHFGVKLPARGEDVALGWAEAAVLSSRGIVVVLPRSPDYENLAKAGR